MNVYIGKVATFPTAEVSKEQAKKILEEAAEVYAEWQIYDEYQDNKIELLDECADLITAVCNLVQALGYKDLVKSMERCKQRNVERGRL